MVEREPRDDSDESERTKPPGIDWRSYDPRGRMNRTLYKRYSAWEDWPEGERPSPHEFLRYLISEQLHPVPLSVLEEMHKVLEMSPDPESQQFQGLVKGFMDRQEERAGEMADRLIGETGDNIQYYAWLISSFGPLVLPALASAGMALQTAVRKTGRRAQFGDKMNEILREVRPMGTLLGRFMDRYNHDPVDANQITLKMSELETLLLGCYQVLQSEHENNGKMGGIEVGLIGGGLLYLYQRDLEDLITHCILPCVVLYTIPKVLEHFNRDNRDNSSKEVFANGRARIMQLADRADMDPVHFQEYIEEMMQIRNYIRDTLHGHNVKRETVKHIPPLVSHTLATMLSLFGAPHSAIPYIVAQTSSDVKQLQENNKLTDPERVRAIQRVHTRLGYMSATVLDKEKRLCQTDTGVVATDRSEAARTAIQQRDNNIVLRSFVGKNAKYRQLTEPLIFWDNGLTFLSGRSGLGKSSIGYYLKEMGPYAGVPVAVASRPDSIPARDSSAALMFVNLLKQGKAPGLARFIEDKIKQFSDDDSMWNIFTTKPHLNLPTDFFDRHHTDYRGAGSDIVYGTGWKIRTGLCSLLFGHDREMQQTFWNIWHQGIIDNPQNTRCLYELEADTGYNIAIRTILDRLLLEYIQDNTGIQTEDILQHRGSGGEGDRLQLLSAITQEPGILILDEVLKGLDPDTNEQMVDMLAHAITEQMERGTLRHTIIITHQDADRVMIKEALVDIVDDINSVQLEDYLLTK